MRESTWRTATHRAQPTHTADQDKPRWRSRGGQTGPQPLAEGHQPEARYSVLVSRAKLENHHFRLAHFGCSGRIGHQSKAVRRPRLQTVRAQPCLPLRGDAKRQSGGGFVRGTSPPRGKRSAQQQQAAKGPVIGVAWRLRHRTGAQPAGQKHGARRLRWAGLLRLQIPVLTNQKYSTRLHRIPARTGEILKKTMLKSLVGTTLLVAVDADRKLSHFLV